jgi:predicted amidophosphoribosyltransferase
MIKLNLLEKILSFLGFENPHELELKKIEPERLNIIKLEGLFDKRFALDKHSIPLEKERKWSYIGELVYRFKYKYEKKIGLYLSELISEFIKTDEELRSVDFILPVPTSFRSRPFHPVLFLVEEVSKRTGIPFEKELLIRTRLSRPQKDLHTLKSKRENVKGLFALKTPYKIKKKKVLIVDDLFDSGATLNEITDLLKSSGCSKVYVLTLTKTDYIK